MKSDDALTVDAGFIIGLNELDERVESLMRQGVSLALVKLLEFAEAVGASHLRVDSDGPVIEGLPTFEWE